MKKSILLVFVLVLSGASYTLAQVNADLNPSPAFSPKFTFKINATGFIASPVSVAEIMGDIKLTDDHILGWGLGTKLTDSKWNSVTDGEPSDLTAIFGRVEFKMQKHWYRYGVAYMLHYSSFEEEIWASRYDDFYLQRISTNRRTLEHHVQLAVYRMIRTSKHSLMELFLRVGPVWTIDGHLDLPSDARLDMDLLTNQESSNILDIQPEGMYLSINCGITLGLSSGQ